MPSRKFWDLTWWDWGLWIGRILHQQRQRLQDQELIVEMSRSWMTEYRNSLRTKESDRLWNKEDFFRLSYDTTEQKAKLTNEETMKMIKERFKKYLKNG